MNLLDFYPYCFYNVNNIMSFQDINNKCLKTLIEVFFTFDFGSKKG